MRCLEGVSLVAGGGFGPQSLTDSSEVADSTMVRNAKNGYKGNFFIQFSFSFPSLCRFQGSGTICAPESNSPQKRFQNTEDNKWKT